MCRCGDLVSDDCGGKEVACVADDDFSISETAMRSVTFQQRQMVAILPDLPMRSIILKFGDVVCYIRKGYWLRHFQHKEKVAPFWICEMVAMFLPMSAPLLIWRCGLSFLNLAMWSAYIRKGRWLHFFRIGDAVSDVPTSRGGCGVFCSADCSMLICRCGLFLSDLRCGRHIFADCEP